MQQAKCYVVGDFAWGGRGSNTLSGYFTCARNRSVTTQINIYKQGVGFDWCAAKIHKKSDGHKLTNYIHDGTSAHCGSNGGIIARPITFKTFHEQVVHYNSGTHIAAPFPDGIGSLARDGLNKNIQQKYSVYCYSTFAILVPIWPPGNA